MARPLSAQLHERRIDNNPRQPGREPGSAFEAMEVPERRKQTFLNRVLTRLHLSVNELFCSGGVGCLLLCSAIVEDNARGNVSMFEPLENVVDRR